MGESLWLVVRRGRPDTLAYDDGIVLDVAVLDPSQCGSTEELLEGAGAEVTDAVARTQPGTS
jgi:hypothetical protein